MRAQKTYAGQLCAGCGIDLADGYALGCKTCYDRRDSRLRKGQRYTPTGHAGEAIDNQHEKGRIVHAL